jgi:peptide-methionine (S)-S-oxide reductase
VTFARHDGYSAVNARQECAHREWIMAKALFAAGCFWEIEDTFRKVAGVHDAVSGYSGGATKNPSYEDVCSGQTGHAETVEVEFDPAKVSYEDLVRVFYDIHDPTTLDSQGPDFGSQYRSAIFTVGPDQEASARKVTEDQRMKFRHPIVTEIVPAAEFWPAEEYHQHYHEKHKHGVL